jgi:hypothetical protein
VSIGFVVVVLAAMGGVLFWLRKKGTFCFFILVFGISLRTLKGEVPCGGGRDLRITCKFIDHDRGLFPLSLPYQVKHVSSVNGLQQVVLEPPIP